MEILPCMASRYKSWYPLLKSTEDRDIPQINSIYPSGNNNIEWENIQTRFSKLQYILGQTQIEATKTLQLYVDSTFQERIIWTNKSVYARCSVRCRQLVRNLIMW